MRLNSLEKAKNEVIEQLVDLWKTVFGDSEDYIRLLVPYLQYFDCYAVMEDGKIVSAFYLLPSEIKTEDKVLKGCYLYAAATYEEYRKNGYMSSLIKEALNDKKSELDFISLVPANEGLYSYYGRFGFEAVMYNCRTKLFCQGEKEFDGAVVDSAETINRLRKNEFDNIHLFTDETMSYALSCYDHFSSHFKSAENFAVLYVKDENTVYEGIFSIRSKNEYLKWLKDHYYGEIEVVTPYELDITTEKNKCGMICDFSGEIKNSYGIYMNHTLI